MKRLKSYIAFVICVFGMLFTNYGMIAHGLNGKTIPALICSCSCAVFIWAMFNAFELIKKKT